MCTLYQRGLLPSAARFFAGSDNWILQEDNDPKHRSKIAKKWKAENGVRVLPWPSMSPDQNPIENIWQIMKMNIRRKKIRTLRSFKAQITNVWNRLNPVLSRKLVDSIQNRITSLVKAEGDYTLY